MASEKWAGFTAEDIEKFKTDSIHSDLSNSNCQNSGPLQIEDISKNIQQAEFLSKAIKVAEFGSGVLEKTQQFGGTWKIKGTDTKYSTSVESLDNCTCENLNCENYAADLSDESSESNINGEKTFSERSLSSNADLQELEIFEVRQKRIEAENARRRTLINKAIMDKKKRTQAEASKLSQITEELKRLDSMLSSDVSILRNYIEKASMEFSEAEKRYLKAEKELIEAKFLLFEKMQKKEQLTEHLCAIIEQNENRKANKLVELMKQLEMETVIEDFEMPDVQPILSKYCVMNEEAYHCCQTLKPSIQKGPFSESHNHETEDKTKSPDQLDKSSTAEDEDNST